MNPQQSQPVAGYVRVIAVVLLLCTVLLLVLGGYTTSFKAGMADPIWPTEPWYIIVNSHQFTEKNPGYVLEHTHRILGWIVGGLSTLLAVAAWWTGPHKITRIFGYFPLLILLVSYGDLHRRMMQLQTFSKENLGQPLVWPLSSFYATAFGALALIAGSLMHLRSRQPGRWVRFWASIVLIGVMIQGLLGGLRVFLDQELGITRTLGVELAGLHGAFAQVCFAAICCLPILCRNVKITMTLEQIKAIDKVALALPILVFVQLVWAIFVRHAPTPTMQRLHILTAFAVLALAMMLAARSPHSMRFSTRHLLMMLGVQILLGVEAWMTKFAAQGTFASMPPQLRPVTIGTASIRTLHQLIGAAILASTVVIALRIWRMKPYLHKINLTQGSTR